MNDRRNSASSPEDIKLKSSLKRKRGKIKKIINLQDLEPFFSGSLMDAAIRLGGIPFSLFFFLSLKSLIRFSILGKSDLT